MSRNVIHEIATSSLDADAVTQIDFVNATGTDTTASTSWATIADSTINMTLGAAAKVLFMWSATCAINDASKQFQVEPAIDGARVGQAGNRIFMCHANSYSMAQSLIYLAPSVSAGARVFSLEWKVNTTGTASAQAPRQFVVVAFKR